MCVFLRVVFFSMLILVSSSCTLFRKGTDKNVSELQMYNDALSDLKAGKYHSAQEKFQELMDLYPASYWTVRAQLDVGYIKYRFGKYEEVVSITESLIRYYPSSPLIEYAYYLKVNAYYSLVEDIERDGSFARHAIEASDEYIKLFPKGSYIDEIMELNRKLNLHLRLKNFAICRNFVYGGYYLPAIKCFDKFISEASKKEDTEYEYMAESRYRLVQSYLGLSLERGAKESLAEMEKSRSSVQYPHWLEKAKNLVK